MAILILFFCSSLSFEASADPSAPCFLLVRTRGFRTAVATPIPSHAPPRTRSVLLDRISTLCFWEQGANSSRNRPPVGVHTLFSLPHLLHTNFPQLAGANRSRRYISTPSSFRFFLRRHAYLIQRHPKNAYVPPSPRFH